MWFNSMNIKFTNNYILRLFINKGVYKVGRYMLQNLQTRSIVSVLCCDV